MPASTADLLRMRLLAHALDGLAESDPASVVRRLLAVQAQDFGAACWALGLRAPGSVRADVIAALDAGTIIRSWPMRGTLHFVPPADLGWMLEITTHRMITGLTLRHRQLELENDDLGRARDLVTGTLAGGGSISRAELMELWETNGIATAGQRGYHLIYYLAQTGVLCWGPAHKTQQSLVLLDEWVPNPRRLEHDEALGEFIVRYLAGHGPATIKDFVWWTKGTMADARAGIAVAGDRLTSLEVDGTEYWVTSELADRDAARAAARTPAEKRAVALTPAFDEYVIGYQNRDLVLDPAFANRVVPGGNGVFAPVIVSRGRAAGLWKRRATATKVAVHPEPFGRFAQTELAGVARGAKAYGRFLGVTASVDSVD
ncbi:winged helix DNA-binding domain-containing protein [Leifsonia sp. NPDC058248]|uniref:winged helix DNA-binding domain-containing protein n=1 Tax=Leifsonia sp. NPDC058248 TaxID=3346402 RepID=UPI0036DB56F5